MFTVQMRSTVLVCLILARALTETGAKTLLSCNTARRSGQYLQCSRGDCQMLGDSDVDWSFDQPETFKMTPALREQLSEGERLNISFTNTNCPLSSEKNEEEEKDEGKVPRKIHMIWIGSTLPQKYWKGPLSFSILNPGDKKSDVKIFRAFRFHRPPMAGPSSTSQPTSPVKLEHCKHHP